MVCSWGGDQLLGFCSSIPESPGGAGMKDRWGATQCHLKPLSPGRRGGLTTDLETGLLRDTGQVEGAQTLPCLCLMKGCNFWLFSLLIYLSVVCQIILSFTCQKMLKTLSCSIPLYCCTNPIFVQWFNKMKLNKLTDEKISLTVPNSSSRRHLQISCLVCPKTQNYSVYNDITACLAWSKSQEAQRSQIYFKSMHYQACVATPNGVWINIFICAATVKIVAVKGCKWRLF